jgi:hypothetical protein
MNWAIVFDDLPLNRGVQCPTDLEEESTHTV